MLASARRLRSQQSVLDTTIPSRLLRVAGSARIVVHRLASAISATRVPWRRRPVPRECDWSVVLFSLWKQYAGRRRARTRIPRATTRSGRDRASGAQIVNREDRHHDHSTTPRLAIAVPSHSPTPTLPASASSPGPRPPQSAGEQARPCRTLCAPGGMRSAAASPRVDPLAPALISSNDHACKGRGRQRDPTEVSCPRRVFDARRLWTPGQFSGQAWTSPFSRLSGRV